MHDIVYVMIISSNCYALFSFMNLNFVILLNKMYCVDDDDEFG
jgi:hypothetical protein